MHKFIMDAIEKTLKDWGVLLLLGKTDFDALMGKIELALGKVID